MVGCLGGEGSECERVRPAVTFFSRQSKGFVDHPGGVRLGKPQEVLLGTDVVEKILAPGGSGWYVMCRREGALHAREGCSGCWRGPGGPGTAPRSSVH